MEHSAEERLEDVFEEWIPGKAARNELGSPLPSGEVFGIPDTALPNPPRDVRSGPLTIEHGIVDVPSEALRPALLWRLFKSGARAVRVLGEPVVSQLWQDLMPASESHRETRLGEILPWAGTLQSLARNYQGAPCVGQLVGDVFYVRPPVLTYVARKMVVYPRDSANDLVLEPGVLHQDGGTFQFPGHLVRSVWDLGARLLEALSAPGWRLQNPAVAFERLKYDASLEDLHQRVQVVRNALGPWAQVGHRLDELLADTAGPIRTRFLRDAFALARLQPQLSPLLERINRYARRRRPLEHVPSGSELAGEPHTDHRLYTCLSSRRVGIQTEFLSEDGWRELPVTQDSLVIFPGELARAPLGLEPTRHRILHVGNAGTGTNETMLIGLSPRAAG